MALAATRPQTTTDRVLTVRQPYASAIIHSGKDVENRGWTTDYRGRLWIHAGLGVDPVDLDLDPALLARERGKIIGHVTLVDVVTDSDSEWAMPGCFHWVLADPHARRPVPFRGSLGLRPYTPRS